VIPSTNRVEGSFKKVLNIKGKAGKPDLSTVPAGVRKKIRNL
jgi:hypothetical protein